MLFITKAGKNQLEKWYMGKCSEGVLFSLLLISSE
jgi:hypothetical protein